MAKTSGQPPSSATHSPIESHTATSSDTDTDVLDKGTGSDGPMTRRLSDASTGLTSETLTEGRVVQKKKSFGLKKMVLKLIGMKGSDDDTRKR